MPITTPITLEIAGDTPASIQLLTLTGDGVDVFTAAGLTPPAMFTNTSGIEWVINFKGTGAAVYAYTYRITWSDASTLDEPGTRAAIPSTTNVYATASDVQNKFGIVNVRQWSDLNNNGTLDTGRVAIALTFAYDAVNATLRNGPYVLPLTVVDSVVKDWVATLAGVWLYQNRGQADDSADGNKYEKMVRNVYREMGLVNCNQRYLAAARISDSPTGPVSVPV